MNRGFAAWTARPRRNDRKVFRNAQDAHIQEAPNHQSKHKNESDNQGRALRASVRNVPQAVAALKARARHQCPMPNTRRSALIRQFPGCPSSARCCSMGCVDQNAKGQNQYRRLLIDLFVQITTEGHGRGRLRRGTKKCAPFLLALHQSPVSGPKGREGAMAPLGANQDAKTTSGSGELLSETAPMEKHPASLTAGSMFARLAGIGVLLLGVVGTF